MRVLVVGSGGREHAIVDALFRSPSVDKIFCAPGNAGIAQQAECVAIKDTEVEKLKAFVKENAIDLTVVGPEAALAVGIADEFRKEGLKIFGHTKSAARIETSKEFAKELMAKPPIPTRTHIIIIGTHLIMLVCTLRTLSARNQREYTHKFSYQMAIILRTYTLHDTRELMPWNCREMICTFSEHSSNI